jgi:anti-sigma regulatory factor (Ser/Thr protein kinase)
MNAVEWGGKLDPREKCASRASERSGCCLYRIADPGEGFDIDGLRHAAISNPEHDPIRHLVVREEQGLRPGGFGLAMTRSLVDELIYNEARNEVIFVKYLE